jgi:hypothetical protein
MASPAGDEAPLRSLPRHFRPEVRRLEQAGVRRWEELAALRDAQLRSLAAAGTASEARLRRLRGQAQLVVEVGLAPADAALLLHAGIPSRQALAEADPQRLLLQVGRLQRTLAGDSLPPIDRALVRDWIRRARRASGRSAN